MNNSEYTSYKVLNSFKEELIENNFYNIPDNYEEKDIVLFSQIFEKWLPEIRESLVIDFKSIFKDQIIVAFKNPLFIINDIYSQGLTYIALTCTIKYNGEDFILNIKYLVFEGRINISLNNFYVTNENSPFTNKKLTTLFNQLKGSTEKPGYFLPIELKYIR